MMAYGLIENGKIIGLIVVDPNNIPDNAVEVPNEARNGDTWENGEWTPTPVPDPPLGEYKAAKLAELAAIRWRHETGGINFSYQGNNVRIPTDRDDVTQTFMALTRAEKNAAYSRKIKLADGVFVVANAQLITAVAGLVDKHIQDCFDNEALLTAQIINPATDTVAKVRAIDLNQGWPS